MSEQEKLEDMENEIDECYENEIADGPYGVPDPRQEPKMTSCEPIHRKMMGVRFICGGCNQQQDVWDPAVFMVVNAVSVVSYVFLPFLAELPSRADVSCTLFALPCRTHAHTLTHCPIPHSPFAQPRVSMTLRP